MTIRDDFFGQRYPVKWSADLTRIVALPRRPRVEPGTVQAEALIAHVTAKFTLGSTGPCRCRQIQLDHGTPPTKIKPCLVRLNYAQAWMLHEMAVYGSICAHAATGIGKTIVDILGAMATPGCQTALLLVPVGLLSQLTLEWELLDQHMRVPSIQVHDGKTPEWKRIKAGAPMLHVLPYSRLSGHKATVYLENLLPDVIFADEVQNLATMGRPNTSTRASRLWRYFTDPALTEEQRKQRSKTKFSCWSGTLTDDEIQDYGKLTLLSLREGSPLPLDPEVEEEWGTAINPSEWQAPGGALIQAFCRPEEDVQEGFHRRLVETPGFIATSGASIDAEMHVEERAAPPIPNTPKIDPAGPNGVWPGVADCLELVREKWIRPDGEWLLDALSASRCARELACGLFLRWRFPRKEAPPLIDEWKLVRKEWRSEMREQLKRRLPHMDSPMLLANAAARAWRVNKPVAGEILDYDDEGKAVIAIDGDDLPEWRAENWLPWAAIRDKVQPVTTSVRLDDYLAQDAALWAKENLGIVWYSTVAFGAWVAEISGLPMHGGGPKAPALLAREDGSRSIIASISSHGTGRDGLQRIFSTQLVTQPPSSAVAWEQLLARLSRIGQEAQTVYAFLYRHTEELEKMVDSALRKSLYVQKTMGAPQKLRAGWME